MIASRPTFPFKLPRRRHHDLYGDVAPRRGVRGDQSSQGFPDFQAEPALLRRRPPAHAGRQQPVRPMAGMPELRRAIAGKVGPLRRRLRLGARDHRHGRRHPGLFTAIAAFVGAGDEVIVFEPVYDSHVRPSKPWAGSPSIAGCPGLPARLGPGAQPDRARVPHDCRQPHNPRGLLDAGDLALADVVPDTTSSFWATRSMTHLFRRRHESLCRYPGWRRSLSSSRPSARPTTSRAGRSATSSPGGPDRTSSLVLSSTSLPSYPGAVGDRRIHGGCRSPPGAGAFYRKSAISSGICWRRHPFELLPCHGTCFQLARYEAIEPAR